SVQYDATYSLPEYRGFPCSGDGAEPLGNVCPKAGDVATADCRPYLLSFNGTDCVAPADAQCAIIHDDVWGCAFPKTGYTTAAESETIAEDNGERSDWTTGNNEGVQVNVEEERYTTTTQKRATPAVKYDTTLDTPLKIRCHTDADEKKGYQTGGTTTRENGARYNNPTQIMTQYSTEAASTQYPTEEVPKQYPTEELPTPYPIQEISTPYPTREVLTHYPTEQATTPCPTHELSMLYATEAASTQYPTKEVPAEYPTEETLTQYPTEEVTTEHPTEVVTRLRQHRSQTLRVSTQV
ncbi:hypothetical protein PC116_g21221, partial [Phytophthora cactorum]